MTDTLNPLLHTFLQHLAHSRRLSPHTVTSYTTDILQFENFLAETYDTNLVDATHQVVRSYIVHLLDHGLSPTTINRKLSCLRSFYKYLQSRGHIDRSPVSKIASLKQSKRVAVTARGSDIELLLESLRGDNSFEGRRDHLIMLLLLTCGLRRSELLSLTSSDIDSSRNVLTVMGKGSKQRSLPMLAMVRETLLSYLELWSPLQVTRLIVDADGLDISPRHLYRIIKKRFAVVTTQSNLSPHKLRHTFATQLLNEGADLLAVKELLGHASLAATQVYTHNDINKLKSAYKGAHPRS